MKNRETSRAYVLPRTGRNINSWQHTPSPQPALERAQTKQICPLDQPHSPLTKDVHINKAGREVGKPQDVAATGQ